MSYRNSQLRERIRRPASAVLATALLLAAHGVSAQVEVDDFEARSFTDSRDGTLVFRLFVPRDYDAAKSYPIVTFLHGSSRRGEDNRRQIILGAKVWAEPASQAKNPAFVLAPQCPSDDGWGRPEGMTGYGPSTPVRTVSEILDALEEEFSIDPDRMYITGQSGGGWGTLRVLGLQPHRFAAGILVCPAGAGSSGEGLDLVAPLTHLPLWFFHGTADRIVPFDLTVRRVDALRQAGAKPLFTEYPGVKHDAWTLAYREKGLVDWLFAQQR